MPSRTLNYFVMPLVACFVISCGSGGGSQSPPPQNQPQSSNATHGQSNTTPAPFSIEFQQRTFSLLVPDREQPTTVEFIAQMEGDPGVDTLHIFYDVAEGTFQDHFEDVTAKIINSFIVIEVLPREDLWSGDYDGEFIFLVCSDSNCDNVLAESPYTIPYSIAYKTDSLRIEPESKNQAASFNELELVIESQIGITPNPVNMRLFLPEKYDSFELPENMIAELQVSNISRTGFTFIPPMDEVGINEHLFNINLQNSETTDTAQYQLTNRVYPHSFDQRNVQLIETHAELNIPENSIDTFPFSIELFKPFNEVDDPVTVVIEDDCDRFITLPIFGSSVLEDGFSNVNIDVRPSRLSSFSIPSTCDILFYYGGQLVDTFTLETVFYSGFTQNIGVLFSYTEYQADLTGHNLQVFSDENSLAEGTSWFVTSNTPWIVFDDQYLTPQPLGTQLPLNVDWDTVKSMGSAAYRFGEITLKDEAGILEDSVIRVQVTTKVPEVTSISPSTITAGQPFTLQLEGYDLNTFQEIAIQREGQTDGLAGLSTPPYTITSPIGSEILSVEFDPIPTPGTYELFILTATERESNLDKWLSNRVTLTVLESNNSPVKRVLLKTIPEKGD